jgi:hypothetical protein
MKVAPGFVLLAVPFLCGCHTAKDVAVTSFRVIDAPANYVRRHLDEPRTTTTTTVTDVTNPGQPIEAAPPPRRTTRPSSQTRTTATAQNSPRQTRTTDSQAAASRNSPAPSQRSATAQQQYPTAKPVPGKPGFVFSPYDPNGGYVDVTGYASGSKAKDPYSQKVFVVP